jgi:hypothetical protein
MLCSVAFLPRIEGSFIFIFIPFLFLFFPSFLLLPIHDPAVPPIKNCLALLALQSKRGPLEVGGFF